MTYVIFNFILFFSFLFTFFSLFTIRIPYLYYSYLQLYYLLFDYDGFLISITCRIMATMDDNIIIVIISIKMSCCIASKFQDQGQ